MGCVRTEHECDHVVMTEKGYKWALRRIYVVGLILGAWIAIAGGLVGRAMGWL